MLKDVFLLFDQVKGIKKLENFVKREREIQQWRDYAGPEDIDYFECQLELQQDLLKSYNFVERIIGKEVFLAPYSTFPVRQIFRIKISIGYSIN